MQGEHHLLQNIGQVFIVGAPDESHPFMSVLLIRLFAYMFEKGGDYLARKK